jgi:4'-phosphopantetheinyl transferase
VPEQGSRRSGLAGAQGRPVWRRAAPRPVCSGREIHLWRARLDLTPERLGQLAQTLSQEERCRAERFHFPKDRLRFIARRGLLRTILGGYLDIAPGRVPLVTGIHGKPELSLREGVLHFSSSHSGGLALCAVARDRPVGVDLERLRPVPEADEIAQRFFSARERADFGALRASAKRKGFFRCWTRKEAYLKAIGVGLCFPLEDFDVTLAPEDPPRLSRVKGKPREASRWVLEEIVPLPGYLASLAVVGRDRTLLCLEEPSAAGFATGAVGAKE